MSMLLRRAMMSAIAGSQYDPYFEQVVALLHAEGSNGGTSFIDSSNLALSYTQAGSTTSTTQIKFGTTSGSLLTNSSYVLSSASMPAVGALQDFTDEGWFRVENFSASHILMLRGTISGAGYEIYTDINGAVRVYGNGAEICATGNSAISVSTWFHCALTRAGGVWKIWINGVLGATSSTNNLAMSGQFQSGAAASYGLNGYFDDIRSTLSVARYTTTFTPPTTTFPDSSNQTYATWNPSDKAASITLSGGNLIASTTTAISQVRATIGKSSGKWYWEVLLGTGGGSVGPKLGIATSGASLSNWTGAETTSWGYYPSTGELYTNSGLVTTGASATAGDTIGFALDMSAGTLAVYKNGSLVGTFSSISGTVYPAAGTAGANSVIYTANFGATRFKYTIPAGFNPGLF